MTTYEAKVLPHKVVNTLFTFSYDGEGKMIEDGNLRGKEYKLGQ